ncbi:hypothetical protein FJQ98_12225 [Lysinibacillus agricola]|uniref:Uncharacterized protein n=1 Tax=Lysinibacillus agricola TaxID=2590012 RepID=A0ABX7AYL7_9BACI|nr:MULTISPECIES: hypothetical protein [Lysinibacillus]KOS64471.1 hypothetical protein AN161_02480 [Lysinibacillus sp. FJAT-14222]QQP14951.1 hypothetical protein FJQ98_12225 [Lysinibacillus agricola]
MKKILFAILFSVLVVGAAFIIYLKSNPPLVVNSFTNPEDDSTIRIIEIENKGLREIELQQILVNDKVPENVELVVSKSEPFEVETKLEGNPNITYHKLRQVNIFPSQYIDRQAIGKQPQHYAVKVEAPNIKKITIKYDYLKMPFTLTAELQATK